MAFGSILDWGAESITASLFVPVIPADKQIGQWFQAAFQEQSTQINESVHAHGRVGHAASTGKILTKVAVLQPGRIELQVQGVEKIQSNAEPPVIQDITGAIDEVVAAAKRLVPEFDEISRLAVNCRLVKHEHSLIEANKKIVAVVPFKINLESESDFVFQINSVAKVSGFSMNRLIKWSVENIQLFAGNPFGPGFTSQQMLTQFFSAFAHLDFNTVASHLMLERSQVPDMLDALGSEVVRVRKNSLRFR
ncbi:hypothetical protein ACC807_33530 [Rhizobium ruizarguesonis]|nr:hypothetical protein E0H40_35600 [Rhizobium leguminosarum bv. viciae]